MLDDVVAHHAVEIDPRRMLTRDQHVRQTRRLPIDILDRHLRLTVRTQIIERAVLTHIGQPLRQPVRQPDRHRHQIRRVITRIPEHHALITRADLIETVRETVTDLLRLVDPHRNVRRLLIDRRQHRTRIAVEPERIVVVPDTAHRVAHHPRIIHIRLRADLTRDHHHPRRAHRLARHPRLRILLENRIQHRITDLIRHLVRMTLGHRLRRERERTHEALRQLLRIQTIRALHSQDLDDTPRDRSRRIRRPGS